MVKSRVSVFLTVLALCAGVFFGGWGKVAAAAGNCPLLVYPSAGVQGPPAPVCDIAIKQVQVQGGIRNLYEVKAIEMATGAAVTVSRTEDGDFVEVSTSLRDLRFKVGDPYVTIRNRVTHEWSYEPLLDGVAPMYDLFRVDGQDKPVVKLLLPLRATLESLGGEILDWRGGLIQVRSAAGLTPM